jgi:hypothetical protein
VRGSMTERRPGVWRLRVFVGTDPVTGANGTPHESFEGHAGRQTRLWRRSSRRFQRRAQRRVDNDRYGPPEGLCDHSENVGAPPVARVPAAQPQPGSRHRPHTSSKAAPAPFGRAVRHPWQPRCPRGSSRSLRPA